MEIRYIRKLMTSHMVIVQAEVPTQWEAQMIAHASMENVLFGECICEDGECNLWYDITGKRSLDTLIGEKELNYELLSQIFLAIYETVERLENILLRAEGLLLLPETIFWDYRGEQIVLCYYPGSAQQAEGEFVKLMEYLLARINHADERAVELAYEIYRQISAGEWNFRMLKGVLCMVYEQEELAEEDNTLLEMAGDEDEEEVEDELPQIKSGRDSRSEVLETVKTVFHKLCSILGFKPCLIQNKFRCNKKHEVCDSNAEKQFVFEPEIEVSPKSHPTVLLSEIGSRPEGIFRYEGKGQCEDIVITESECLIGSERICAGYIPSKTVSRRHARVTCTEGIYFIEDLNSSNGTYVGGQILNYKTKVSLQKNEIVIFADEKFRFI